MYLSKYIRRCDFMDNMNTMDFNQKIDVSLRASLEATPVERNASDDLSTGSSSDGFWNLIVLYTGSPQTLQNEFPSSSFTFLLGNYAIVKISEDDIPSLAAFPQVIYIERPRQLFFEIVSARQASCLSAIQENSSYGLTGKGILISVIDSGIDYAHPDFCNPDKTTRLVALWDQTILADPSAGRFAPAGYSQGTLFSPEQINAALQADTFEQRMELVPSTDVTGHGTHVAGIAAGNGRASGGLYRGIAPESSLLAVKLGSPDPKGFPNTIELMQAVDFSVRYAIEHTVPLVINLSFGNTYGSHSGTSLLETYLDYVSNLGRINIVVGSGNEGNNGGHASARLASLESARIEFAVGNYESSLSIQIWKNYWDDIRFQLTPPGLGTSFKIPNQPGSWRFSFGTTQILVYYGLPSPYSLYQEIAIDLLPRRDYISGGVWFFTAEARSVIEGIIDLWMPAGRYPRDCHTISHADNGNHSHDTFHRRKCHYRRCLRFFHQYARPFFRQRIYLEYRTGQTGSGRSRCRHHQLCCRGRLRIPKRHLHGCSFCKRQLRTAHAVGHSTEQ